MDKRTWLLIGLMIILTLVLVCSFFYYRYSDMTPIASDTNILFIHHSTGGNLLNQWKVRELLKEKSSSIKLWDHGYNLDKRMPAFVSKLMFRTGLSDQTGTMTGRDYDMVLSNNSPREYAEIFARDIHDTTLQSILTYDVVIIKNCFPTTKIDTDELLNEHKRYYESIRDSMAKYPSTQFIIFTPPPLRAEVTEDDYAQRANELANWMVSDEFVAGVRNVRVFDFFHLLADSEGENAHMLKREYAPLFYKDSHPNKKANREIAPLFVKMVVETAEAN